MHPPRAFGVLVTAMSASVLVAGTAHADGFAHLDPVSVAASPVCGGTVSAEAQLTPVQAGDGVASGIRVAIRYDAGIYDGSCALTVTATWANLDTGDSGSGDITAVSTIDGHYGFVGYASTTFDTGAGAVVVTLSSHPGADMLLTA